ncbi:hypothetical protein ACTZGB_01470 [Yersinia bercovieri]|uniref:hypothetical protein n=1 Tax=Yersinia TaxID=629 RepID=UPI0005E6C0E5|nr:MULTISPECIES: hypothetical protein [Yersinia]AOF14800.1 hypothetical protein BB936_10275 [Yersinia enterocolitica]CFV26831.1 Uncharacterised protein [Yersinia enterocolitica]
MIKTDIQFLFNEEMERRRVELVAVRADRFAYGYLATRSVFKNFKDENFKFHEDRTVDIFARIELLHGIAALKTFKKEEKSHKHFTSKIEIIGLGCWNANRFMRIKF